MSAGSHSEFFAAKDEVLVVDPATFMTESPPARRLAAPEENPLRKVLAMGFKAIAVVLATVLLVGAAQPSSAAIICTAADVIAAEAGCSTNPATLCTINSFHTVAASGCVFDFGERAVTVTGSSRIDALNFSEIEFRAGTFTILTTGQIRGNGSPGASSDGRGASIKIQTTGDFIMLGTSKIDVSGTDLAGDITIETEGNATIEGLLDAFGVSGFATAGSILVNARGNIATSRAVTVTNPTGSFSPGAVELVAGGDITIGGTISVAGGDGGDVVIDGGGNVTINAEITARGTGDAGSGGSIDIIAGRGVVVNGNLRASGTSGSGNTGGSAGTITVEAQYGDISITGTANITANGSTPDGDGDEVSLTASGSIILGQGRQVTANTLGYFSAGGVLAVDAGVDVIMVGNGTFDAAGGYDGGEMLISAGRNIEIRGNTAISVAASSYGGFGGSVIVDAGLRTRGTLLVDGRVNSGGGQCNPEDGCGAGGFQSLIGCNVNVASSANLQNRGADGGDIFVTARGLLTVNTNAVANATSTVGSTQGGPGSITWEHSSSVAPSIAPGANVNPAATVVALAEPPCTVCGNGVLELGEECDDGNTVGCDGCSFACEIEDCDDSNPCTVDSCQNLLGCRIDVVPAGTPCCDGSVERSCAELDDQCNFGTCNPLTDACESQPVADLTPCDDGLTCTDNDSCLDGTCGFESCACVGSDPEDPCEDVVVCLSGGALCRIDLDQDTSACVGTALPTAPCCGNGIVDPSEACDEGGSNSDEPDATCRVDCRVARCGDGIVDPGRGEMCDDGNEDEGDGCTSGCLVAATYTPTPSQTFTPSLTPTPTATPTSTATPTATATFTPLPGIAGQVLYYAGVSLPVADVEIALTGPVPTVQTSAADGSFDFPDLLAGGWRVAPRKSGADNGAVTAYDAALALQESEASGGFSAGQGLACDVNGDGVVDTADVELILQLRVGLISAFPVAAMCGTDWLFLPTSVGSEAVLPDPGAPTCEPGGLDFTPLAERRTGQDLLGILLGDCTGNWQPGDG